MNPNPSKVLIGKWGKIVAGKDAGLYVFVQDDSAETGGFFIFTGPAMSIEKCWENWFEKIDGVQRQFQFDGWEIQWLDSDPISSK